MAPNATARRSKLGIYTLPSKAVNGLLEAGVDETNIDDFSVEELMEESGFGSVAAKMLREQRGKQKASKRRAASTRENGRAAVQKAKNMRLVDEAAGHTVEPRNSEFRGSHDSWLDMPEEFGERDIVKTLRHHEGRLELDIGPEHGLQLRHAMWAERIAQNAPPEMLIDSIERLIVVLLRGAMAADPTKGGTIGVPTVSAQGVMADFTPRL